MFLQTASHLGYIKTTTLPPIFRVSLATICSHPLTIAQFPQSSSFFPKSSLPAIWTVGSPDPTAQTRPGHLPPTSLLTNRATLPEGTTAPPQLRPSAGKAPAGRPLSLHPSPLSFLSL